MAFASPCWSFKYRSLFFLLLLILLQLRGPYAAFGELFLTPEEKSWIKSHPVIRVTADPYYHPIEYLSEDGSYKGLSIDYLELVGRKLGLRFELVASDSWEEALAMVRRREADMLAAGVITKPRREYLLFTEPHIELQGALVGRKGEPVPGGLDELSGLRVGVVSGFFWQDILGESYPDIHLIRVRNIKEGLERVSKGDVDVMVVNMTTATWLLEEEEKFKNLTVSVGYDYAVRLSIPSRSDWPILNKILEKGLSKVTGEERRNLFRAWINLNGEGGGDGTWYHFRLLGIPVLIALFVVSSLLLKRYGLPGKFRLQYLLTLVFLPFILLLLWKYHSSWSPVFLTDKEKEWLGMNPVIRLAPDPDFPPMEFFDESGNYSGIAADYVREVEQLLGIRMTIVRLKDWDEVVESAKRRAVDMFGGATKTPQRSEYMAFTRPYMSVPVVIVARKENSGNLSISGLAGMKVGVVSGYAAHDFLMEKYPKMFFTKVPDVRTGLIQVSFGALDVLVGNLATITYYIGQEGITNLKIGGETEFYYDLSFAVRGDWPVLHSILDKAVGKISKQRHRVIYRQWIGGQRLPFYRDRSFIISAVITLIVFFLFFLGILIWNRILRKEVAHRTEELSLELMERRRAEGELRYLRNYLDKIVNAMPSFLAGVDGEGRITHWNREAERFTGEPADTVTGKFLADFLPQFQGIQESVFDVKQTGKALSRTRVPWSRDGVDFYSDITIYPLHGDGTGGSVVRIDDVTERVAVEEMVAQSRKMISVGGLAAGMAHEINNPLAGIMQNIQVIKRRTSSDLPQNRRVAGECGTDIEVIGNYLERRGIPEMIGVVMESVRRAAKIVDNMLSISRGGQEEGYGYLSLEGLLEEALGSVFKDSELKKIVDMETIGVLREYDRSMPEVYCHGEMIRLVFVQILRNGIHAMADISGKRMFSFRIMKDKHMARIDIGDNGGGMDEEIRKRVFDPFFTTRSKERGVGLGLSVCYFIITENHGGTMAVESSPGDGARFIIRIPLERDHPV